MIHVLHLGVDKFFGGGLNWGASFRITFLAPFLPEKRSRAGGYFGMFSVREVVRGFLA